MVRPGLINPLLDRPGAGPYRVTMQRLFNKLPIRDTVTHDGRIMLRMLDNSNIFFEVINTANQPVDVELVTGMWGGYVGATIIGLPETVGANGNEGFTVAADTTWGPWVGIRASFGIAPISGFLSVFMAQRELRLPS